MNRSRIKHLASGMAFLAVLAFVVPSYAARAHNAGGRHSVSSHRPMNSSRAYNRGPTNRGYRNQWQGNRYQGYRNQWRADRSRGYRGGYGYNRGRGDAATITATLGMVTGMAGIGTDTPGTLTGMAGIGTDDTGVTIEAAITTGETGAAITIITTGETETTTFSVSMDGPTGEATGEVIGVDGPTTPMTTTGLPIIAAIHSPISSCRGFPSCSACKGVRHGKGDSGTPKRSVHWSERRHCSCWVLA